MSRTRIAVGSDHGGFALKQALARTLREEGHAVLDCGAFSEDPVDYPDIALEVGRAVADGRAEAGLMIDAAGVGSTMTLNRIPGIRAALCHDAYTAANSRAHNDANVLVLGARVVHPGEARRLVRTFLAGTFEGGRHERRVEKIRGLDLGREAPRGGNVSADAMQDQEQQVRRIAEVVLRRIRPPADRGTGPMPPVPTHATTTGAVPTPLCPECRPARPCSEADGRGGTLLDDPDRVDLLRRHGVERVACCPSYGAVDHRLAGMIDHTILRPDAAEADIVRICEEARCLGCATVCIQPMWVPVARRMLEGSAVQVCTVVGFPHGANRPEVKAYETQLAVAQGAREIDMVIPVGAAKGGDLHTVGAHIRAVVRSALPGIITKVILETAFLTDAEKRAVCRIARQEGAGFVKTSTGFGPAGATVDDIRLMRAVVGPAMGVKAAGGIRDRDAARAMIEAGATRIGASASIRIAGGDA